MKKMLPINGQQQSVFNLDIAIHMSRCIDCQGVFSLSLLNNGHEESCINTYNKTDVKLFDADKIKE